MAQSYCLYLLIHLLRRWIMLSILKTHLHLCAHIEGYKVPWGVVLYAFYVNCGDK